MFTLSWPCDYLLRVRLNGIQKLKYSYLIKYKLESDFHLEGKSKSKRLPVLFENVFMFKLEPWSKQMWSGIITMNWKRLFLMLHYIQLSVEMNLIFFFFCFLNLQQLSMNEKNNWSFVATRFYLPSPNKINFNTAAGHQSISYAISSIVLLFHSFQVPHQVGTWANKRRRATGNGLKIYVLCGINEHKIYLLHSAQLFPLLSCFHYLSSSFFFPLSSDDFLCKRWS